MGCSHSCSSSTMSQINQVTKRLKNPQNGRVKQAQSISKKSSCSNSKPQSSKGSVKLRIRKKVSLSRRQNPSHQQPRHPYDRPSFGHRDDINQRKRRQAKKRQNQQKIQLQNQPQEHWEFEDEEPVVVTKPSKNRESLQEYISIASDASSELSANSFTDYGSSLEGLSIGSFSLKDSELEKATIPNELFDGEGIKEDSMKLYNTKNLKKREKAQNITAANSRVELLDYEEDSSESSYQEWDRIANAGYRNSGITASENTGARKEREAIFQARVQPLIRKKLNLRRGFGANRKKGNLLTPDYHNERNYLGVTYQAPDTRKRGPERKRWKKRHLANLD